MGKNPIGSGRSGRLRPVRGSGITVDGRVSLDKRRGKRIIYPTVWKPETRKLDPFEMSLCISQASGDFHNDTRTSRKGFLLENDMPLFGNGRIDLREYIDRQREYKNRKGQIRKSVFSQQKNECVLCHSKGNLTLDHIHPLRMGGTNEIENFQILCMPCNRIKRSKT